MARAQVDDEHTMRACAIAGEFLASSGLLEPELAIAQMNAAQESL